jgi:hypothetical protein
VGIERVHEAHGTAKKKKRKKRKRRKHDLPLSEWEEGPNAR